MAVPPSVEVVAKDEVDEGWVGDFLSRWHSDRVASRGVLHAPARLPGFVALLDGQPVALLTYRVAGRECEITTLHSDIERRGAGTALIERAILTTRAAGCRRLWLITTNDNTRAMRFYQRRGFTIAAMYPRAVDEARSALKPEIPLVGNDGIPIRDEIEFEMVL